MKMVRNNAVTIARYNGPHSKGFIESSCIAIISLAFHFKPVTLYQVKIFRYILCLPYFLLSGNRNRVRI